MSDVGGRIEMQLQTHFLQLFRRRYRQYIEKKKREN